MVLYVNGQQFWNLFSQNEFVEWMHILKHAVVVFYKRGDFIQNSLWKIKSWMLQKCEFNFTLGIGECLVFQHCKNFPEPSLSFYI